jgi:carboxylesterase
MKLALLVFLGLAAVWVLGDWVYSCVVARRIKNWEASLERDDEGVERGCRDYTIGSGETAVLLIHGINDSPACYRRMAPALAEEGFTCRVMRLPGFAEPVERYAQATKEQWLAAVKGEVESLRQDYGRVAIVAHSLGGAVTIAYLLEDPAAVDAVVLLAPAVEVSDRRSPLLSARAWHEIGRRLLWFTTVTSSPFPNDCRDPAQREYPGRTPFVPTAVVDQTFALLDNNRGRAAEFNAPLLMVLAKDDQVVDWEAAERFYRKASSEEKSIRFMEKSGHVIPLDYGWEDLTAEIAEFLGNG